MSHIHTCIKSSSAIFTHFISSFTLVLSQVSSPNLFYIPVFHCSNVCFYYLFWGVVFWLLWGLNSGTHLGRCCYCLSHSTSPFLLSGFFEAESCKLFARGWLQSMILLISASWVATITGMSHQHPEIVYYFSVWIFPWYFHCKYDVLKSV
jgi:hypothetical protein